jgi:hypothetical protein
MLALWAFMYQWQFYNQAGYSDMVTTDTAIALEYLEANHPGEGVVSNAFSMSLWFAGLIQAPSPYPYTHEPPRVFTNSDAHVRCVLGWIEGCDVAASTSVLDVSHILIDERFPFYNEHAPANYGAPPNQWTVTAESPWLTLVFEQGTTKLWRIET